MFRFSFLGLLLIALATPASSACAAELKGVTLDQNGAPVPQADIWMIQNRKVRTATSGADGTFRFDKIDVAMTEVVALKEGYSLGGATALVVGDASVQIPMFPADIISLKVLDSQSKPVAGAQVRSMLVQRTFLVSAEELARHGFPSLRSTDDGILVIPNLPVDGFVQLVLSHPEFSDSSVNYLPVESQQRNIVLQRGQRVGGRVTFQGKGVAGARVDIFRTGTQGQKNFAQVTTDAEGFYTARVEPDVYGVAVRHPDYAPPPPAPMEVLPVGEATPVNLELKPARFIRGNVVLPGKKPAVGTRLTYREGETVYEDTFADNDGRFTLKVPGGPGFLAVNPPRGFIYPSPVDIHVDLGDATDVKLNTIELEPLPVITGTITDAEGKPAGQALVTALNLPTPYSVRSDDTGNFSMSLDFMPVVDKLHLLVEHKLRFQRGLAEVDMKKVKPAKAKLEQYTPDLAPTVPVPGGNNLNSLVGKPAPALAGDTWVNSDPITLEGLKGKVVVMLFWAGFDEDMGPVVMRELLTLKTLLKDVEDVAFISVHDAISSKDEIKQYIEGYGIDFPVLRDADEQTTFGTYGIVFIPQIVLLDKKGNVRYYPTDIRLLERIKGLRREE